MIYDIEHYYPHCTLIDSSSRSRVINWINFEIYQFPKWRFTCKPKLFMYCYTLCQLLKTLNFRQLSQDSKLVITNII